MRIGFNPNPFGGTESGYGEVPISNFSQPLTAHVVKHIYRIVFVSLYCRPVTNPATTHSSIPDRS